MNKLILAIGTAVALVTAAGCGGGTPDGAVEQGPVRDVAVLRVEASGGGDTYRAAGTVRALRRAELATRVMGRIDGVTVRAGDRVRTGQILVTIDKASLSAMRQQTDAGLELARASFHRMERLYADSAIPAAQFEQAKAAYEQAQGQSKAAASELTYADLVAPFSGVVAARNADPGDLAVPGQPVLVIEDDGPREVVVSVPDRVAAQIKVGNIVPVEVGSDARRIETRVSAVVRSADPMSRTIEVRLRTTERLPSNLTAVAEFPTALQGGESLTLPRSAVVERGQLAGAFVVAPDSTLRLRWIRLGRVLGDRVEVASGLVAGDLVARSPGSIKDGERVRPIVAGESGQ
jgi:RND family efflux transporter MFP subunit